MLIGMRELGSIFPALDRQIGLEGGHHISLLVIGGTVLHAVERWVLTQDVSQEFWLFTKHFLEEIGYAQIV